MGFFGLFKGAPQSEKNQESDTFSNLNNLYSDASAQGKTLGRSGSADTGAATNLFRKEAAGDRTAYTPGINAATDSADAAKREEAQMGTSRGGGTNSDNQQIQQHTRALISSLIGENQNAAGTALANIGAGETSSSEGEQGIASGTESNLSSLLHTDIAQKNASAAKMWGSLFSGGLNLATAGLSGGVSGLFGGGSGGSHSTSEYENAGWHQ